MIRKAIPIALGLILTVFCSTASALEEPFTAEKVQISGHLGGGIYLGDGGLNPYGFGLGVRGGYTFDLPIYVGGLFDFFIGESEDTVFGDATARSLIFQVEGGYDLGLADWVVLRPKLGLGLTHFMVEACTEVVFGVGGCGDDSETDFAFQIGAEALMEVGPVFIAPEMRFNIVSDASAFFIGAGVGAAF